jgi:hypothetical protein
MSKTKPKNKKVTPKVNLEEVLAVILKTQLQPAISKTEIVTETSPDNALLQYAGSKRIYSRTGQPQRKAKLSIWIDSNDWKRTVEAYANKKGLSVSALGSIAINKLMKENP